MSEKERAKESQKERGVPGMAPRLRFAERHQVEFRSASLDELLESDHQARLVWEFVSALDLSAFLESVKAIGRRAGRPVTDPRILLSLWIYATLKGVGSARELARLCKDHVAYQWLAGGVSLSHKTLSDFRSTKGELLQPLLVDTVASLMLEGLVKLDRVSHDGMRVRANAGSSSFRRPQTLRMCQKEAEEQLAALEKELEKTPDEIDRRRRSARERAARERVERVKKARKNQKQLQKAREKRKKGSGKDARASTTDPEARNMKFANGGYNPGLNMQFCSDNASGVIVGVDVTNSGNDSGQLAPMACAITEAYGKAPAEYLADGDFATLKDIVEVKKKFGIDVYAPIKHEKAKLAKGEDPYAREKRDCDILAAWRTRMGTEEAKAIYKERAPVAELPHAHFRNRNLRLLPVRGLVKAKAIALLYAFAHNFTRAISLRAQAAAV